MEIKSRKYFWSQPMSSIASNIVTYSLSILIAVKSTGGKSEHFVRLLPLGPSYRLGEVVFT